jgi:monofunctional biosynthetic peptidoglycan transglycosylase
MAARKRNRRRKSRARWSPARVALRCTAAFALASALLVLPWRWIPPPTTAFIVRERLGLGEATSRLVSWRWVPIEQISPQLAIAVVAAEDQKFPDHRGFDFDAISRAAQENRRRSRGASTITQQLAKNLYLWPGRSMLRKGLEAYFTVLIELCWPKQRILEVYLNVVEFGPGTFGAEAASRRFFGRPSRGLTLEESALLAAVLPSPKRMSPAQPSPYVRSRAAEIERSVRALGGTSYLALW